MTPTDKFETLLKIAKTPGIARESTSRANISSLMSNVLKEMSESGPVPVDFSTEIDYKDHSLNIYFSQEMTSWETLSNSKPVNNG